MKRGHSLAVWVTAAILAAAACAAETAESTDDVHPERIARITGRVVERRFFGPPNYDRTSKLVTVKALLAERGSTPLDQRLMQLIFLPKIQGLSECAVIGCLVDVTGKVFEAETGHHYTKYVLEVSSIEVAEACTRHQRASTAAANPSGTVSCREWRRRQ